MALEGIVSVQQQEYVISKLTPAVSFFASTYFAADAPPLLSVQAVPYVTSAAFFAAAGGFFLYEHLRAYAR